jgi:hypothetical protein
MFQGLLGSDLSTELLERGSAIWDELSAQCANEPLPFVKFDPNNPEAIVSFWEVTESGDRWPVSRRPQGQ